MDNAHESTSESKIPVIYTKEHLEREAAKKQRAVEKRQAEQAAISRIPSTSKLRGQE